MATCLCGAVQRRRHGASHARPRRIDVACVDYGSDSTVRRKGVSLHTTHIPARRLIAADIRDAQPGRPPPAVARRLRAHREHLDGTSASADSLPQPVCQFIILRSFPSVVRRATAGYVPGGVSNAPGMLKQTDQPLSEIAQPSGSPITVISPDTRRSWVSQARHWSER
jgi:hypothetical protein